MALPKLTSAKYSLKVPSTGQTVEYRPYLVKEEKILMMAFETKDQAQMISAIRDVIAGCTEGAVKVDKLALFDLEYIFLKLRSKSVGESSTIRVKCESCDHLNEVKIDLNDIEVKGEIKSNQTIQLTDDVGLVLHYPTVKGLYKRLTGASQIDQAMVTIVSSIESIYDAENVYPAENETEKSLLEFLDSLTSDQFKKITAYFEDMPKLKHDVDFSCASCQKENNIHVEGLASFF